MHMLLAFTLFFTPLVFGQTSFKDLQNQYPRVRQAHENCARSIDSLFAKMETSYPPEEICLVAYKKERTLQLWARPETSDTFTFIKQYDFTAFSGQLGPKRQRGDLQIPEGYYHINHFNPYSNFHLSMKISYPNKSDSILGMHGSLGNEIRIHGSSVTIGCIPIGDEAIEELYTICVDLKSTGQTRIPVYIFPCRMHALHMKMLEAKANVDTALFNFWKNLKQGYKIFTTTHVKLGYTIDRHGVYLYENILDEEMYPWLIDYDKSDMIAYRIPCPDGYSRLPAQPTSFTHWLRALLLKPPDAPVHLHDGTLKSNQSGHHAVIDIDVGEKDLQQCADAIMRLRAEYLYSQNRYDEITFQLTNGEMVSFSHWSSGNRPFIQGNTITWRLSEPSDSTYECFRSYLNFLYSYAGSYSLSRQMRSVHDVATMHIGDVFIQGGFPGHAVMVIDMAQKRESGEQIFMLCQSYMPAQDIHILKNLEDPNLTPWYRVDFGDTLHTPEWIFTVHDLKRF